MALKLIGVGIKPDGKKEPFTVSDKTTKAGLEGIIRKYDRIERIVEAGEASDIAPSGNVYWRAWNTPLDKSLGNRTERWTNDLEGLKERSEEVIRAAVVHLLESGAIKTDDGTVHFTFQLALDNMGSAITEPTLIRAKLEDLKKKLPGAVE